MDLYNISVVAYKCPWSGDLYVYRNDGHCPVCGGKVIIHEGHLMCVDDGICTYVAEIIE